MAFCIEDKAVKRLFEQEFLIIPSKMNRKRWVIKSIY
jgi:hypothetical protein